MLQTIPSREWRRSLQKRRKCLQNQISDKGLESRLYKALLQLNNKKITQLKYIQRTWTILQRSNKHMKRYSTALVTREIHLKTTLCYYGTWIRAPLTQNTNSTKCRWRRRQSGTRIHCWRHNMVQQPRKTARQLLTWLNGRVTTAQQFRFIITTQEKWKRVHRTACRLLLSMAAWFTEAKGQQQSQMSIKLMTG